MKKLLLLLIIFILSTALFALDMDVSVEAHADDEYGTYPGFIFDIKHVTEFFTVSGTVETYNNDKYKPYMGNYRGGFYLYMSEGGVEYNPYENLDFKLGRFKHYDVVDSPYSLFINSNGNSAFMSEINFDDERFFFLSRWILLNENSSNTYDENPSYDDQYDGEDPETYTETGYPDRGANFKTWGIYLGAEKKMRVGFQDAAVYTGKTFDAEYFVNPIPSWIIQYVKNSEGKPWEGEENQNSIMGFFIDYNGDDNMWYAQFLADDFSLDELTGADDTINPSKIAWSLGTRIETSIGRFGFFHAGATKFTFEPYGNEDTLGEKNTGYGYTYFPGSIYDNGDEETTIDYEDNYIGYKYGEDNIALMMDYSNEFMGLDFYAFVELTLSGDKSPANPYHDKETWKEYGEDSGTKFLDGDTEKKVLTGFQISKKLTKFKLYTRCELGAYFNKLELVDPAGDTVGIKYFQVSDDNEAIYDITVGMTYYIKQK